MFQLNNIKSICFIGIGGIGMSALARYFLNRKVEVFGYDRTSTSLTKTLEEEGAEIAYSDEVNFLREQVDLVVYTPAIPDTNQWLKFYRQKNYMVLKRSEVLQVITEQSFTIAVAGSHGKTTVTSMIAHVLHQSGYGCTAFVGGIMTNYNSNFIAGNNNVVVIEADEFDRSFHRLSPDIAVITAVDSDHLEVYGNQKGVEEAFLTFARKIKPGGTLVLKLSSPIAPILEGIGDVLTYHLFYPIADAYTYSLNRTKRGFEYAVACESARLGNFELNIQGQYNVENSIAAISVAYMLQIEPQHIAASLATFTGIKRRFEYIIQTDNLVMIDDYAHHPNEISALMESVHQLYADRKVTVVFQPHLFTRTRDLAHEFAISFRYADEVILLDIYPAREEPIEGVTSEIIFEKIPNQNKYLYEYNTLLERLQHHPIDVLVTIGAGNIDALVPKIKEILIKQMQD